jgi:hypothetical protein
MKKGGEIVAMAFTKRGALSTFILVFLISALALIALSTPAAEAEAQTDPTLPDLHDLNILYIGRGELASQLVDGLDEKGADVVCLSDIPETGELNPDVVIIFGGEWLERRVYDTELHDFLKLASSQGASMVMVGGATSKFFEPLDKAGVYQIPVTETGIVRNPAYFNPPLVGFRMQTVDAYTFPSLLLGCAISPDFLEEPVIAWLRSTTPTVPAGP